MDKVTYSKISWLYHWKRGYIYTHTHTHTLPHTLTWRKKEEAFIGLDSLLYVVQNLPGILSVHI